MSLNWNLNKIADYKNVCFTVADEDRRMSNVKKGDRILSPVTNALIWATMGVGITEITAANAGKFYARLHIWEATRGTLLSTSEGDVPLTLKDVQDHIGLHTNAGNTPPAQWLAHLMDMIETDARSALKAKGERSLRDRLDAQVAEDAADAAN